MIVENEQIKRNILDRFYWDSRIEASHITVDVENGHVLLSGNVPNYTAKQAAWNDALITPGVKSVDDQITVIYPQTISLPTDNQLEKNVSQLLALNASVDASNITVHVDHGKIVLKGTVDSFWKKVKAEELINDVIGVTNVVNRLTVVPTDNYVDKDIADDITRVFVENKYINFEDIEIKVENGVVTLTGVVPDLAVKHAAARLAHFTRGVREVVDLLNV